jgi:thioredoxin reductase
MQNSRNPSIAIAGAGPYGLSVAAHLASAGVDFRIFGKPMYRWRCQMPKGMYLKSEGCASSLSDPDHRYTLERYCIDNRLPFGSWGKPVSLDSFVQYSLDFQRRVVPEVEEVMVRSIRNVGGGFELQLSDDSVLNTKNVILATGLDYLSNTPKPLRNFPREVVSHCSQHHDLSRFKGMEVVVVGGGQSAIETAALIAEQGAAVTIVLRQPALAWNPPPKHARRSLYHRLRHPSSGLGAGIELWAYCSAPHLFRYLPQSKRARKLSSVLGPAGAYRLKEQVARNVRVLGSHSIESARIANGKAELHLVRSDGSKTELKADHVMAATGYRFDLDRLPYLAPELRSHLKLDGQMPLLSPWFESTVPGLYFTGLASAMSFGPVMRFLYGADFTAERIARRVRAGARGRSPSWMPLFASRSTCDV